MQPQRQSVAQQPAQTTQQQQRSQVNNVQQQQYYQHPNNRTTNNFVSTDNSSSPPLLQPLSQQEVNTILAERGQPIMEDLPMTHQSSRAATPIVKPKSVLLGNDTCNSNINSQAHHNSSLNTQTQTNNQPQRFAQGNNVGKYVENGNNNFAPSLSNNSNQVTANTAPNSNLQQQVTKQNHVVAAQPVATNTQDLVSPPASIFLQQNQNQNFAKQSPNVASQSTLTASPLKTAPAVVSGTSQNVLLATAVPKSANMSPSPASSTSTSSSNGNNAYYTNSVPVQAVAVKDSNINTGNVALAKAANTDSSHLHNMHPARPSCRESDVNSKKVPSPRSNDVKGTSSINNTGIGQQVSAASQNSNGAGQNFSPLAAIPHGVGD